MTNDEEVKKLQEAWDWASTNMTKYIIEKEQELEVELFFPLLLVCVDALRLRGVNEQEISSIVKERTTIELENEEKLT